MFYSFPCHHFKSPFQNLKATEFFLKREITIKYSFQVIQRSRSSVNYHRGTVYKLLVFKKFCNSTLIRPCILGPVIENKLYQVSKPILTEHMYLVSETELEKEECRFLKELWPFMTQYCYVHRAPSFTTKLFNGSPVQYLDSLTSVKIQLVCFWMTGQFELALYKTLPGNIQDSFKKKYCLYLASGWTYLLYQLSMILRGSSVPAILIYGITICDPLCYTEILPLLLDWRN